jgi:predicted P-loop ATPase
MTATVSHISTQLNLQSALAYAKQGFYVFPVHGIVRGQCTCNAGTMCYAPGKHPRTNHGYTDATTDETVIRRWFSKWPDAGVAIAAGLSGLVVLDIDPRNRGNASLAELPSLPHTPRVLTGGGGWHYYFRKPPGPEFPGFVLAHGIDVKADGGYVIAPPSLHIQGQYRVDPDARLDDLAIADLPDWIAEQRKTPTKRHKTSARVAEGFLGAAFEAAGWLGRPVGTDKTQVMCPWEKEHTGGRRHDGSTVVFAPNEDSKVGWAHCSHSHCSERGLQDWLDAIPQDAKLAARDRLGLDEYYTPKPETKNKLPEEQWVHGLTMDQKSGKLVKDAGNVSLMLANDPMWRACIAYDEFRSTVVWIREPDPIPGMESPDLGPLRETDVTYVQQKLRLTHHVSFPDRVVLSGIAKAAQRFSFHPVRSFLEGLYWDRIPRVDRWLSTYLGAPDTPYTRLVSRWSLIACVARIYDPGCQSDYIPILEGAQGAGKSSALRILGDPWFSDTPIDISNKDAYLTMRGKWIIELSELESLDRASIGRAKAFFTSRTDTYREPYGRLVGDWPRHCNFFGTVNPDEYLHDETGGRRFHPVRCGDIDLTSLARDRDDLWAEAVQMYQDEQRWHPQGKKETALCKAEQDQRYMADEWENVIREWLRKNLDIDNLTLSDIMIRCFGFQPREWNRAHEMRVTKCLKRIGMNKKKTEDGNVWSR